MLGRKKLERINPILKEQRLHFTSPLDEAIAAEAEVWLMQVSNRKEGIEMWEDSYSPLPKRFKDRLDGLPRHEYIHVEFCMRDLYRESQRWMKESAFSKWIKEAIKDPEKSYPYKEDIELGHLTYALILESYWLKDMKYRRKEKLGGSRYIIDSTFETDLSDKDDNIHTITISILCSYDPKQIISYQLYEVSDKITKKETEEGKQVEKL
jgi:hypothetical protein